MYELLVGLRNLRNGMQFLKEKSPKANWPTSYYGNTDFLVANMSSFPCQTLVVGSIVFTSLYTSITVKPFLTR